MCGHFFILGAPKCGTTSLAAWLGDHPAVFMSPVKEPHYFNTDHRVVVRWTARKYARLFEGAREDQLLGEASVWYLYSHVAVRNILAFTAGARFVVCLRNPTEMAYSLHEQQLFAGNEHIPDFGTAWRLQHDRARGHQISRWCVEPSYLVYGRACALGEQMERLLATVAHDRVHVVLLDDLRRDPKTEYARVLHFLGLPPDGRDTFPRLNPAKSRRSPLVRRAVQLANRAKSRLGLAPRGSRLSAAINRWNTRVRERPPLSPEMRQELSSYFEPEVCKLEVLLDRDLRSWRCSGRTL